MENNSKFEIISKENNARTCCVRFAAAKSMETPNCLLFTKFGSPMNLTPDLLRDVKEVKLIGVNFNEIYSYVESLEGYQKNLHSFLNLEEYAIMLTIRNPAENYASPISKNGVVINTKSGRKQVSPLEFMKLQQHIRADMVECISVDVPYYVKTKKLARSVDITLSWLDQCLQYQKDAGVDLNIFGVIQGGSSVTMRMKCVEYVAKREVAGFSLGSFGLGESATEREELIEKIMKVLPGNKPVMVTGLGTPDEILQAVSLGIDLFNSNYPNLLTEWGSALHFSLVPPFDKTFKLNLRDKKYQLDSSPVSDTCNCYCCTNHSRAYVHHLLNTHELLANVLLTIHNYVHYLQFFAAIRHSIQNGQFHKYKELFLAAYYEPNPSIGSKPT